MTTKQPKIIYGVTNRNGRNYWSRIGVAFVNVDDSINLKLDFIPTDPNTTIQVREREPKDGEAANADSAHPQQ